MAFMIAEFEPEKENTRMDSLQLYTTTHKGLDGTTNSLDERFDIPSLVTF